MYVYSIYHSYEFTLGRDETLERPMPAGRSSEID